jgi:hypothetical protein
LTADGFLMKRKPGRSNYYINAALHAVLAGEGVREPGEQ